MADVRTVDLRRIPVFVLHAPTRDDRAAHIRRVVADAGFRNVTLVAAAGAEQPQVSGCLSYGAICERLSLQEPFEPALVLEDDVALGDGFRHEISFPADADAVYLGVSVLSAAEDTDEAVWGAVVDEVSGWPNLVRPLNMFGLHAVLFCSRKFAAFGVKACAYCAGLAAVSDAPAHWDIPIARRLPHFMTYAFRNPLFFQDAAVGGQEHHTRALLLSNGPNVRPDTATREPIRWRHLRSLSPRKREPVGHE